MTLHDDMMRMQRRIDQLERELRRHEERTEGLSAEETYQRAKRYIAFNPQVWHRIKRDARMAVANERRFSIAKEFEELRQDGWLARNEHEDYKCNNTYRACLVRFLMVEVPGLEKRTTWRKSKIDRFFPELKEVLEAA